MLRIVYFVKNAILFFFYVNNASRFCAFAKSAFLRLEYARQFAVIPCHGVRGCSRLKLFSVRIVSCVKNAKNDVMTLKLISFVKNIKSY